MNQIKYIVLLFLVLAFAACSGSYLDLEPKGVWHHGNIPDSLVDVDSETLVEAKVLENYSHLRSWAFSWAYMAMTSIASDDADKGSSPADGSTSIQPIDDYTHNASNSVITDAYQACFSGIVRANEGLALVTTMEDGYKKDQLAAEAQFMRALFYFRLVRCYGGVPLVTSVLATDADVPARESAETIYGFIEDDLNSAIDYLPTKDYYQGNGGIGRATQEAAKAYLAKVYLYQERWADVLYLTEDIINNPSYDLSTPIDKIFTEDEENGKESLFEMQAEVTNEIDAGSQFGEIQGIRGTPDYGWGFNVPSTKLVNAFENNDPRFFTTVLVSGTVMPDGLDLSAGYSQVNPYYNMKMYQWLDERNAKGRNNNHGRYINDRLLRTADVILMYAEAANELGYTEDALAKLELVRARARNGNASVLPKITSTDKDKLRDAIRQERRIELAMEHERYFDLIRWGLAEQELGPLGWKSGINELYPIPQEEIDKSNGVLFQNPGY